MTQQAIMELSSQEGLNDVTLPETAVLLKSAAEAGNWELVTDILSSGDVSSKDVKQSLLLQELVSDRHASPAVVRDIIDKVFLMKGDSLQLKSLAKDLVDEITKNDTWDFFVAFVSAVTILYEDESNLLTMTQSMLTSQTLKEKPYLHMDVLCSLWRHAKHKLVNSKLKSVVNTLVQLAAKFNMWSRVCDLLVCKPDLNLLDRDGLSVLHRLVMCPDSRFDSLLPVLLENGADITLKTWEGDTALHLAATHQKTVCVKNDKMECTDIKSKIMNEHHTRRGECKLQALRRLLSSAKTLDDCDSKGNTAVILAAKNNNWEFFKLLLEHGARADVVGECQRSVLHVLALTESSMDPVTYQTLVTACISNGTQLNSRDVNECSALHLAVESQNWTLFSILLNLGGDPEVTDAAGYNVLHRLAMTSGEHLENVSQFFPLLHQRGADLSAPCPAGNTVLHLAVQFGNLELVKHLIHLGTSVFHFNRDGFTILHCLVLFKLNRFHRRGQRSSSHPASEGLDVLFIIDLLLQKGVDLEHRCTRGDTALHLAARHQNWTVFKHLLQRGAKIHEADSEGVTVLQRFIESTMEPMEEQSMLRLILIHSTVKNTSNQCGDTVLQAAAKHEKWEVVEYILRNLHDGVEEKDSEGLTVLERMAMNRGKPFKEGLFGSYFLNFAYSIKISKSSNSFELSRLANMAAKAGNVDVVVALLDRLDGVNKRDCEGFTILHRVVQFCVLKSGAIIRRLVERGADVDMQCPGGNTALHLAAKSNNWLAVRHLLEHRADISSLDDEGMSVVHRLVGQPHFRCTQCRQSASAKKPVHLLAVILSNAKAELVSQRDPYGNTPLQLAVRYEHWDMVMELLARGASLEERDSQGCTVVHTLVKRCDSLFSETSSGNRTSLQLSLKTPAQTNVSSISRRDFTENNCLTCSLNIDFEPKLFLSSQADISSITENCCLHGSLTDVYRDAQRPFLFSCLAEQDFNHLVMCDHFIDNSVLINSTDDEGNTPLLLSAMHNNWDITERLLLKCASPNLPNHNRFCILHILAAVSTSTGPFLSKDMHKKILQMLISCGADVGVRDPDGNTPIQLAAKHGNMDMVEWLLEFEDNVNETDSEGFTLLSRVAQTCSPISEDIARHLVKKGADVNMACPKGRTPLVLSVINRNWPVTSALWYSTSSDCFGSIYKEDLLILHSLVEDNSPGRMTGLYLIQRTLFRRSDILMQRRFDGMTPIQLAIVQKKWDLVVIFLNAGEYTDFEAFTGSWVFHVLANCAKYINNTKVIHSLMPSNKLNMNLRDDNGNTPLNILADDNKWTLVKLFVELGADVNLPDSNGLTVVHKLAMSNYWWDLPKILLIFVEFGADVHTPGPEDKSAVMMAIESRNWPVFWQLVQLGACYDWDEADKCLLLKKLCHFPKSNCHEEKLSEIINCLTQSSLNSLSSATGSHQAQNIIRECVKCSKLSTIKKFQSGPDTDIKIALQNIFEKCATCSNWIVAKALLQSAPDLDIKRLICGRPLIHVMVSLYDESDHVTWLSFLTALLNRGLDINSRDEEGRTVLMKRKVFLSFREVSNSPKALYRVLLKKGLHPSIVDYEGNSLLTKILMYSWSTSTIVKRLLEIGLLSCQPELEGGLEGDRWQVPHSLYFSRLKEALGDVKIPVFRLLIECGAVSNSDLFSLNTEYQLENELDSVSYTTDSEAKDMCQVLEQAASEPRSLESLCRLAVCRSLPFGVERSEVVMSLPIPNLLKDYLLFSDVLADLHSDTDEDEWDYSLFYQDIFDTDDTGYYEEDSTDDDDEREEEEVDEATDENDEEDSNDDEETDEEQDECDTDDENSDGGYEESVQQHGSGSD